MTKVAFYFKQENLQCKTTKEPFTTTINTGTTTTATTVTRSTATSTTTTDTKTLQSRIVLGFILGIGIVS